MNIFYLDESPLISARYMNNKHVVKMIVETCQLLSTAHRILDGYEKKVNVNGKLRKRWCMDDLPMHNALYQCTHQNHPSAVWVRQSTKNYEWLYNHFLHLLSEYTFRYGKNHKSEFLIPWLKNAPKNTPQNVPYSHPPQCMPDHCKDENTVEAYRKYYMTEKDHIAQWVVREKPDWYEVNDNVNNTD